MDMKFLWLDSDGKQLPQEFFDGPDATSDYAAAYCQPARMIGDKLVKVPIKDLKVLALHRYQGYYQSHNINLWPHVDNTCDIVSFGGWHGETNEVNDTLPYGTKLYSEELLIAMGVIPQTNPNYWAMREELENQAADLMVRHIRNFY